MGGRKGKFELVFVVCKGGDEKPHSIVAVVVYIGVFLCCDRNEVF